MFNDSVHWSPGEGTWAAVSISVHSYTDVRHSTAQRSMKDLPRHANIWNHSCNPPWGGNRQPKVDQPLKQPLKQCNLLCNLTSKRDSTLKARVCHFLLLLTSCLTSGADPGALPMWFLWHQFPSHQPHLWLHKESHICKVWMHLFTQTLHQ